MEHFKRTIPLAFILLITTNCIGQLHRISDNECNTSGASRLLLEGDSVQAVEMATFDIANGKPILLIQGGIAPIVVDTDRNYEGRFKVHF